MSRPRLVKLLKEKNPQLNKQEIELIYDSFCNSVQRALKSGKKVEIRGFGTFFVKKLKEKYSARNPRTGELINIPEKNKVRFRPSKNLKKLINE